MTTDTKPTVKHHRDFEMAVCAVIGINTGLIVPEGWHEYIEAACLVFFVIELLLRLRGLGWKQFLRSPWCLFDSTVIGLAWLPLIGVDVTLLRIARLARLVHLSRHVSQLRWVRVIIDFAKRQ